MTGSTDRSAANSRASGLKAVRSRSPPASSSARSPKSCAGGLDEETNLSHADVDQLFQRLAFEGVGTALAARMKLMARATTEPLWRQRATGRRGPAIAVGFNEYADVAVATLISAFR